MRLVSIYNNAFHSGTDSKKLDGSTQSPPTNIELDIILESIQNGLYEKQYPLKEIRLAKQNFIIEEERIAGGTKDEKYEKAFNILKKLKDQIPRFTISGVFKPEARKEANLSQHSGFIDLDIDKLGSDKELEELRLKLSQDVYTYSVFKTCGGDGLCLIFLIDKNKQLEAFEGIKQYLFEQYGIVLDNAHKNIANTRNVSYDTDLYLSPTLPEKFTRYLKKKKVKEEKVGIVYAKNDFEQCVKAITGQQLDFCNDYESYFKIGFAIASKFGLAGLEYFDQVCQYGEKYNPNTIAKDYKHFCRSTTLKTANIASFFYRCKTFGIEIYSSKTRTIGAVAAAAWKSGRTKEDVIKNLEAHDGLKKEDTEHIVNQVFDEKIDFVSAVGILDEIQAFIKYNYDLKVNTITCKHENHGVEWTDEDLNSCYVDIKKAIDKADAKWMEKILYSSFIPRHNPILEFFEENKHLIPEIKKINGKIIIPKIIQDLWLSVQTTSQSYLEKFGTKWLVGAISTWLRIEASPLELVFVGELSKGKTHFIKYLLPPSLSKYYAEIKLDGSDNSFVIMCQKLIINQNERKCADNEKHKDLLDKDVVSMRKVFRRNPEDLKRLAVPFGSANGISDVLTDRYGNRRIIVVEVKGRDHNAYDDIDKTELWMAVYALFKAGYDWKILGEDISELNHNTSAYEKHGLEYEMISKYFEKCGRDEVENLRFSASEIKDYIESRTQQKLKSQEVIQELYRMGFIPREDKINGFKKRFYDVKLAIQAISGQNKDLPF